MKNQCPACGHFKMQDRRNRPMAGGIVWMGCGAILLIIPLVNFVGIIFIIIGIVTAVTAATLKGQECQNCKNIVM